MNKIAFWGNFMSEESLDHVINALYEAVLEPDKWQEAVGLCGQFAGGIDAQMLTIDKIQNRVLFAVIAGEAFPLQFNLDYEQHYVKIDPHVTLLRNAKVHEWNFCQRTIFPGVVNRSEFYQDFLLPRGLGYALLAVVDEDESSMTSFVAMRSNEMRPFDSDNKMDALRFSSHLQRAIRMQQKMTGLLNQVDLGAMAIDALSVAILIVDDSGRILHLNQKTEELFKAPASGLKSRFGCITTTEQNQKHKLNKLIFDATRTPAVGGAMELGLAEPRHLYVIPLSASSPFIRDWQRPLALVVVTDNRNNLSALTLTGRLYNLTQAELRVASALLAGDSPEEYALEFGVKLNTVRTQLKSLFSKTGTRRQSELVAVLGRTPPLKNGD